MVREHACSHRKGVNGREVSPTWLASRVCKKKLMNKERKIKFAVRPTAQQGGRCSSFNVSTFRERQTPEDRMKTSAIDVAQWKRRHGIRPKGVQALYRSLSRADKKRKPTKKGENCIAVCEGPYGCVWEPCFFENLVFENAGGVTWCLVKRTEYAHLADGRLSKFFAVLQKDCFLVPSHFSKDWLTNYLPNTGVYVIESFDTGNIYVGSSKNIQNRIADHNQGKGASFTAGGKWFRIVPSLSPEEIVTNSQYSAESQETLAQINIASQKSKRIRVVGGYRTRKKCF